MIQLDYANKIVYILTPSGIPVLATSVSMQHVISLTPATDDISRCDEQCTAPIYNYSRFLHWAKAVEDVCGVFQAASEHARQHHSVDPLVDWDISEKSPGPGSKNRTGTVGQVEGYCTPVGEPITTRKSRWPYSLGF